MLMPRFKETGIFVYTESLNLKSESRRRWEDFFKADAELLSVAKLSMSNVSVILL